VIVANGRDTQFLLPEHYPATELKISKLQMLRLAAQKPILKSNILTGLTIRRYESFHSCPSYAKLTSTQEQTNLQNKGIHILFKQAEDGSIILGDSHEYVQANRQADFGFDISSEINEMMLHEAKKIIDLPDWNVDATWAGYYLQGTHTEVYTKQVDDVIHIINGIGGKGMTTSPGFTSEYIQKLYQK
jgi:glycine/D-amino acid oxidase-like deaminating enzyme